MRLPEPSKPNRLWSGGVLCALSLFLALAPAPLTLHVSPQVGFAPLTIRVTSTILPDARNRFACLSYASDIGDDSTSCWELDGERAPRTTTREYVLPAGEYVVGLTVYRADRAEVHSSQERVRVIARQ